MSSSYGLSPASPQRLLAGYRRGVLVLLVTVLTLVVPRTVAHADPGDIDMAFGTGGRVTTDFFGHLDGARDVAVQDDGKIVAGGYISKEANDPSIDFGLTRYNPDGTLDDTFGSGGKVRTDFAGDFDEIEAIAIQPDGRIVAAGFAVRQATGFDMAVARYMPDGTPDSSFGTGGKATFDFFQTEDYAEAVALLPGGAILIAGAAVTDTGEDFALARVTADGRLDSSFGSNGKRTSDFFNMDDEVNDMAIADDGEIVLAGVAYGFAGREAFAVARYSAEGTPDSTFGIAGLAAFDVAGFQGAANSVVVQPDGMIVMGGAARQTGRDFGIARLTVDGRLDATFGEGGLVKTDFFGFDDRIDALRLLPDGRIVAAGTANHGASSTSSDMALARYNADGTLDTTFAAGGMVTLDFFAREDFADGLAVDADGNYVLAGADFTTSGDQNFALARIEGDPVVVEPDFALALASPTLTVTKGQKGQIEVLVNRVGDFTQEVSVSGPDTKPIKVKLTPPSAATTGSSVTFNFKIKKKAAVGSYDLVFTGIDGSGRSRMVTLTLVIQ